MKLKSVEYSEYDDLPWGWHLENCTFHDINLIVGKNATGKTRTLNVVSNFANLLSANWDIKFDGGSFDILFEENGADIRYAFGFENRKVAHEQLTRGDKILLQRGADGKGTIFAAQLKTNIAFQPPPEELAVVSRRDAIQHPFLNGLYDWGKFVRHFQFGTQMGRNRLVFLVPRNPEKEWNPSEVVIFKKGNDLYGNEYTKRIIEDMKKIGYELDSLSIGSIETMDAQGKPLLASGFHVKEKDLNTITPQTLISAGMFRALSLIIQLNYLLLASQPSCIIIDDIGEGLDYSRSTALIDLLINKVKGTNMQLIMSTNDRFVMNSVPIQYWSVIQRFPGKSVIYNYRNSKEIFDDFEFTGLSNFDFFTSNYFLKNRG